MAASGKPLQLSILLVTFFAAVAAIPLDLSANETKIQRLTSQVKLLTKELQNCQNNTKDEKSLFLRYLQNKNVTCNDGTTAGYYVKRSDKSKNWIIFLEGGWFCFDDQSCAARMNSTCMKPLMTSSGWSPKRKGTGILSADDKENPTWWNANHVIVPYCSSDAWSGNVSRSESGGKFSFMGYRIINEVIKELLLEGLIDAQHLLFAGSSAGGIGVTMNVDRVAEMMHAAGSSVKVRGLSDSGWYLEAKDFHSAKCQSDPKNCDNVIVRGMNYWQGVVPKKCAEKFLDQYWRCYFAHNIYGTLKSPLFIFQWQYDQTQMIAENPANGINGRFGGTILVNKIFKLARDMKHSLKSKSVSAVFLPACISHAILTKSNWLSVKVKGYTLDKALNCWIMKGSQNYSPIAQFRHCPSTGSWHIDDCKFPQCNQLCPLPRDPFTGKLLGPPNMTPMGNGNGFSIPQPSPFRNMPAPSREWNS